MRLQQNKKTMYSLKCLPKIYFTLDFLYKVIQQEETFDFVMVKKNVD